MWGGGWAHMSAWEMRGDKAITRALWALRTLPYFRSTKETGTKGYKDEGPSKAGHTARRSAVCLFPGRLRRGVSSSAPTKVWRGLF